MSKITDFLKSKRDKKELAAALSVLRDFKACESKREYLGIPFAAWAKLEQLEEYLDHMVNGAKLKQDTIAYMEEAEEA